MTENKDKDKDKDKDKEKEHDRSVISHLVDAMGRKVRERGSSTYSDDFKIYKSSCVSVSESFVDVLTLVLETGELNRFRQLAKDEQIGTQRVYKKTSPNSVLTLYLPTREVVSCGTNPAILKGILFVDPKLIQGYRVYAQLTLTFRYGREDEEVMGLRFCNEAIMSLHQIWPRTEEPTKESLTPLQDALMKRLGEGAHPFTLSLTPQAPPSVQLVPAKRYYGAPIGTSYDVRCFIDKTDEKFHRRASVKMGIRVIHRTDVFSSSGPENFAALVNNQSSPPPQDAGAATTTTATTTTATSSTSSSSASSTLTNAPPAPPGIVENSANSVQQQQHASTTKHRKSERGDSFPKIRLSPKSFRFSSRFGRSKSEAERGPSDPFYNYSKSFQEYETGGGPQGAVDKPFLLQEGRVGLRASLDKSWYTHGEDVIATVNIKNDSRKSVRRMRVCAIQHVDVCMFNNGKFKNVVADSDVSSPSGTDRIVGPGGSLNATIILKPQRGPTKNWIALEDSLQRSSEPDEITGAIAASAVRNPPIFTATGGSGSSGQSSSGDDRNVFAIYVSYYVKVKLTLSGMGGELSLKLPFALVHVDSSSTKHNCGDLITSPGLKDNEVMESISKLTLTDPMNRITRGVAPATYTDSNIPNNQQETTSNAVDKIESIEDDVPVTQTGSRNKRKLMRHETVVKDLSSDEEEAVEVTTAGPCIVADKEVPKSRNEDVDHHHHHPVDNNPTTSNQQTTCVQIHASSS